jgi:hypothetical protein
VLARLNADVSLDSIFGCSRQVSVTKDNAMSLDTAGDSFVLVTHAELSPAGH